MTTMIAGKCTSGSSPNFACATDRKSDEGLEQQSTRFYSLIEQIGAPDQYFGPGDRGRDLEDRQLGDGCQGVR
jgi:hypothetical protein